MATQPKMMKFDPKLAQRIVPKVRLSVIKIEPQQPVENTEVTIHFTIQNSSFDKQDLSGEVSYVGAGSVPFRVDKLKPGAILEGVVKGTAPRALANAIFQIGYTDDTDPFVAEFRLPTAYGDSAADVAATYMLSLSSITCSRPRNGRNNPDKLTATCTATWEGTGASLPVPPPADDDPVFMEPPAATIVRRLGDINSNQTILPAMSFGPFNSVPGKSPAIRFSYLLVNTASSEGNDATYLQVFDDISKGGQAVASVAVPSASAAWGALDGLIEGINAAIAASCDGPVAANVFLIQSSNMEQFTFATGNYSSAINYDSEAMGVQTPVACGRAPYYTVWSSFVRLSQPPK